MLATDSLQVIGRPDWHVPCDNGAMRSYLSLALLQASLLVCGCSCSDHDSGSGGESAPPDTQLPDDTAPPVFDETECPEAEQRLGYPACEHSIPSEDSFEALTIDSTAVDQLMVGKYMVPAVDGARLPPVFMYVDTFTLHYDFLITAFPDLFSGLTTTEYMAMILYPDTREFYAGTYSLYMDSQDIFYGFTVWDDPADASSTIEMDDVTEAWEQLQERFLVGELYWVPYSSAQESAAEDWDDAPFPIRGLEEVVYEVYNPGTAYGYMTLYTLDTLEDATEAAEYSYQNILAIEEAPMDLERVVSAIITGTRQGDLSHLNVRSAARGTPNCYLLDPLKELDKWDGLLVKFECGDDDWSVATATWKEAEAWWDSIRPDPVDICEPDVEEASMPALLELATATAEERTAGTCAYGSKGTNLATLYQRIDAQYTFDGFLVPFYYYDQFIHENTWTVDLGEGEGEYSFAETLEAWHADDSFIEDAADRRDRLETLRDAMIGGEFDAGLLKMLETRILDEFGSEDVMVRFRSSSNAEDALTFSGAGLYESESVCLADSLDDDTVGPSLCDPDKDNEETLTEGLGNVWASLWYMQAWEERDWYAMDQSQVSMGILVNNRSKDEQANIVAFSGNPTSEGDDRYLVNAQEGELEVVSTDADMWPEKVLLTIEDGVLEKILRVTESSECEEVLTDAELTDLGELFWDIAEIYPQDQEIPKGYDLLWDTEWKITSEGRLVIKQIRPYLR